MTHDVLQSKLAHLPDSPGVYLFKDAQGEIIYIGKAALLTDRVRSYFQKGADHSPKTSLLVSHITDLETMVTRSELEALILESNLVKRHKPRFNIVLRDDKQYPYVRLPIKDDFPRLSIVRRCVSGSFPAVLLCPIQALMQAVPDPARLDSLITTLRPGERRTLALGQHPLVAVQPQHPGDQGHADSEFARLGPARAPRLLRGRPRIHHGDRPRHDGIGRATTRGGTRRGAPRRRGTARRGILDEPAGPPAAERPRHPQ